MKQCGHKDQYMGELLWRSDKCKHMTMWGHTFRVIIIIAGHGCDPPIQQITYILLSELRIGKLKYIAISF